MTVRELIDLLEGHDGETEVRLATQPNYPLQSFISGVASLQDLQDSGEIEQGDEMLTPEENIVYITEGQQCPDDPYAHRALWGF